MYQKERLEHIMSLLHQNGYVTVKFLTKELGYSTATLNRDLNLLVQMKRVRRSYGGVEALEVRGVPLVFRYEKNKLAKKKIGRRAAELVEDGDVIFIDGTTTTQCMGEYLLGKKEITVITNNMALAIFLAEHGVRVKILGGEIAESPFMLDGSETVEQAGGYWADKCFIAPGSVQMNAMLIGGTTEVYFALHKIMISHSNRRYLLMDKSKIGKPMKRVLGSFSLFDCVISDHAFQAEERQCCPDTEFLIAE